ncbi:MerR family transcriptional regulator [Streptomyces sp. NPDC005438]|uniref:MerR family transcriptional regulator n=1 Tax=Streptomyces sp. NPDC005438 TaxID=3156880 RepID=UPI0033BA0BE1
MPAHEYRIEDLAQHSGTTVRTIRAYQDRGLLPTPERRGRSNVYDDTHLSRLRQIADLLDRGYTLASIRELLDAWDSGKGLAGVLGLVGAGGTRHLEDDRVHRDDLRELFGGERSDEAALEAIELGVLVPVPDEPDQFLVPSPQELVVAAELHRVGVPLLALTGHLRELRSQVEHIAARFLDFSTEHAAVRQVGSPSESEIAEAASLVRRLRPLAQQTVDAELARAMRLLASDHLAGQSRTREQLLSRMSPRGVEAIGERPGEGAPAREPERFPEAVPEGRQGVPLPDQLVRKVEELVGEEHLVDFVVAATTRELAARTMDQLAKAGRRRER